MTPGVSAGSNHVGAIETVAAKVTCPSAARAGAASREPSTIRESATADARDRRWDMSPPHA
jgi:hypothetical protein